MVDDIKCHYMGIKRSVLIRQNDLWDLRSFHRNKIIVNLQKTKMRIFPLYFGEKPFVKFKSIVQSSFLEIFDYFVPVE